MSTTRPFPDGFLFGAATAAYQIEGAAFEDGRTASIWDTFARVPGAVANGDTGDVACDHYHRYADDVQVMKQLGLQTYRFSTSWARVRPDGGAPNPKGIDFYSRLVDELLEADILPWLTLYHWDLPQALEDRGGWTNRDVVDRFVEYTATVHDALGDRVKKWTTLNEPWCAGWLSYTGGEHAPGRQSVGDGMLATHHLLLSHGKAVEELRRRDASLDIGLTLNLTVPDAADPLDARDIRAVRKIDGQFNRWFLDPVFKGTYPKDIVRDLREIDADAVQAFDDALHDGDLETISTPIDFLGVNYYHGELLSGHPQPEEDKPEVTGPDTTRSVSSPFPDTRDVHWVERGLARTAQGWEIQPDGLTRLLDRVATEYAPSTPLYVTENGAAFNDVVAGDRVPDEDRVAFVKAHLGAVLDSIDNGTNVAGYFYWSLMDNFEWAWGYLQRFGIVRVDYDTQVRTVKDSGYAYAQVIADRALTTGD